MAHTSQITRAAMTDKRPIGSQAIDHYGIAEHIDDTEDISPDAALYVKRLGNKHDCAGTDCAHPGHVDDVAACNMTLILLGLTPDPFPSVERERRISPDVRPAPAQLPTRRRGSLVKAGEGMNHTWTDRAACRDADGDLFFGGEGERQPEREEREARAKKVCGGCPVKTECLTWAIRKPEAVGVWGGKGEDERPNLRRRAMRQARAA